MCVRHSRNFAHFSGNWSCLIIKLISLSAFLSFAADLTINSMKNDRQVTTTIFSIIIYCMPYSDKSIHIHRLFFFIVVCERFHICDFFFQKCYFCVYTHGTDCLYTYIIKFFLFRIDVVFFHLSVSPSVQWVSISKSRD